MHSAMRSPTQGSPPFWALSLVLELFKKGQVGTSLILGSEQRQQTPPSLHSSYAPWSDLLELPRDFSATAIQSGDLGKRSFKRSSSKLRLGEDIIDQGGDSGGGGCGGPCKHTRREEGKGWQTIKEMEANRSCGWHWFAWGVSQGLGRSTTIP